MAKREQGVRSQLPTNSTYVVPCSRITGRCYCIAALQLQQSSDGLERGTLCSPLPRTAQRERQRERDKGSRVGSSPADCCYYRPLSGSFLGSERDRPAPAAVLARVAGEERDLSCVVWVGEWPASEGVVCYYCCLLPYAYDKSADRVLTAFVALTVSVDCFQQRATANCRQGVPGAVVASGGIIGHLCRRHQASTRTCHRHCPPAFVLVFLQK
jgi:hypothetical protein